MVERQLLSDPWKGKGRTKILIKVFGRRFKFLFLGIRFMRMLFPGIAFQDIFCREFGRQIEFSGIFYIFSKITIFKTILMKEDIPFL